MFKKLLTLVLIVTLSILILGNIDKIKEIININDNSQEEQNINTTDNTNKVSKETIYDINGVVLEDSGITQTIKEVCVFNNMAAAIKSYGQNTLVINEYNRDKVTVVVKFEIKNNNNFPIYTYPTQSTMVTNTGEEVKAHLWASESFDGEINQGQTKEGHVLFNLETTPMDELKTLKIIWTTNHDNGTSDNYEDDYQIENNAEIILN